MSELSEHFRRLLAAVAKFHPATVPEGRPGPFGEKAVLREEILAAPEDVFPFELTMVRLNVGTFLDGGFSLVDGDVFEPETVFVIERSFTAKFLILDGFHGRVVKNACKDTKFINARFGLSKLFG